MKKYIFIICGIFLLFSVIYRIDAKDYLGAAISSFFALFFLFSGVMHK